MNKNNFDDLQITWNDFGKSEPFWSVLTSDNYKSQNVNEEILDEFYESGYGTILLFEQILQKYNFTFKDKIVLDFGCGVGRLTKACNDMASKVYGMDISESHLKIAKQKDIKSDFFLVDNLETLPKLPNNPDIITSLIVLQHARPELIRHHVDLLLKILNKNGIALLHIPYDIINYQQITSQTNVMEMHFVPKSNIMKISNNNNCLVLGIEELDFCGSELIKNCVYVIKKN